jgi:hypothetical protein
MSGGQTAKHRLPPLDGLDDRRLRDELYRWAVKLPVGLVGCVVRDTAAHVYPTATQNVMSWNVTDYESDKFFAYDSTPAASQMVIPEGLGGLYAYSVTMVNNDAANTLAGGFTVRVTDASTGAVLTATEHDYTNFANNQYIVWAGTIPRILRPGDKVDFTFRHTSAGSETLYGVAATTTHPAAPSITFYRVAHSDPTG